MPSFFKIALLAFATVAVAVPSSPNANEGAIFGAVEKRCSALYAACGSDADCCSGSVCNLIPMCQSDRCVPTDPNVPYNPTC